VQEGELGGVGWVVIAKSRVVGGEDGRGKGSVLEAVEEEDTGGEDWFVAAFEPVEAFLSWGSVAGADDVWPCSRDVL